MVVDDIIQVRWTNSQLLMRNFLTTVCSENKNQYITWCTVQTATYTR